MLSVNFMSIKILQRWPIEKYADYLSKISIFALAFLLPIFFTPWTSDVLDFNKQALLAALVFISLVSWIVKSLINGHVTLNLNGVNFAVATFFIACLTSCVFSVFRYGSFWGWPNMGGENMLSIMCFCVLYFLVSTTFDRKEISVSLTVLSISLLIVELYGIIQLSAVYLLPFSFAKNIYFNTIGSVGSLGLFSVSLLPLSIILLIVSKKWWKVLFIINIALAFIVLVIINYNFLWWLAAIGSFLMMIGWLVRRDIFDARWMALPTFFLMVSLFFVIFHPQLPFITQKPVEIFLSPKANLQIDMQAIRNSPVIGSGLGTFAYDFLKYKPSYLNDGSFWNAQFNNGTSKMLSQLATLGIFGVLAWLALITMTLFYGIRQFLLKEDIDELAKKSLLLAVLLVLVVEVIGAFLYNFNASLDFIWFFFIAICIATAFEDRKTYILKPSSPITLVTTIIFTAIVISGIGIMILQVQRYVAAVNHSRAVTLFAQGNTADAFPLLQKAASLNATDLYFRQLSQAYLFEAQNIAKSGNASVGENPEKIKSLVSSAINSAKLATDINPKTLENWSVRGNVYQNLIGLVDGADTWAITSYDKAIELSPDNPYLLLQRGISHYQVKNYNDAQADLERALSMKKDYSDVLYFLGLTYDQQGQRANAIDAFTKILSIKTITEAQAQAIQKIIGNLNLGKSASGAPVIIPAPPVDSLLQSPSTTTPK